MVTISRKKNNSIVNLFKTISWHEEKVTNFNFIAANRKLNTSEEAQLRFLTVRNCVRHESQLSRKFSSQEEEIIFSTRNSPAVDTRTSSSFNSLELFFWHHFKESSNKTSSVNPISASLLLTMTTSFTRQKKTKFIPINETLKRRFTVNSRRNGEGLHNRLVVVASFSCQEREEKKN